MGIFKQPQKNRVVGQPVGSLFSVKKTLNPHYTLRVMRRSCEKHRRTPTIEVGVLYLLFPFLSIIDAAW
jgi:hypothetical protein